MAKRGRPKTGIRRAYPRHTAAYLTPEMRRNVDAAAEKGGVPVSTWLRQLIIAELGRLAARERLADPA